MYVAARCSLNTSHNYCHFPGELSEGADSPEAQENKSKDVDGEFILCLGPKREIKIKKWHLIENRGMDGEYALFGDNR